MSAIKFHEAALADFFAHVTPEDLRFRFLSGMREVSHERLNAMIHVDHRLTEDFLASVDGGKTVVNGDAGLRSFI